LQHQLDCNSKPGVPKLSLVMYPFSILRDEHVPLKCLMAKKLRKKEKIYLPISLQ